MALYDGLFIAEPIAAIFSEKNTLQYMLNAEAALAIAQAQAGLFDSSHATAIAACCNVALLDIDVIKNELPLGANAAIPLVKQLTKRVAQQEAESAKYVHLGATSQDIVDTASMLQIKDTLHWFEEQLAALEAVLVHLTKTHRNTLMMGRTLQQQARPITFGLKISGWLSAISRAKKRVQHLQQNNVQLQLAGAVGSRNTWLSSDVLQGAADQLGLLPALPWHTQRDNLAEVVSVLGITTGTLGKIAKDILLLSQTELGEVAEGAAPGKGASSTMPHKRNPVVCAAILANAHRVPFLVATYLAAMPHAQERSAGLWHSEWPVLADVAQLGGGALEKCVQLLETLEVFPERMAANIQLTNGLIFAEEVALALAAIIGKAEAHHLVEQACKVAVQEGRHLKTTLLAMPDLPISEAALEGCFQPEKAIGDSLGIIDDILQQYG